MSIYYRIQRFLRLYRRHRFKYIKDMQELGPFNESARTTMTFSHPQSFLLVVLSALLTLSFAEAKLTDWSSFDLPPLTHPAFQTTSRVACGYATKGCVREPTSGRALTGYSFTSRTMTITFCVAKCDSLNLEYAGAEYASTYTGTGPNAWNDTVKIDECYRFQGWETGGALDDGADT
ncbi:hypothetical protein R3P38DRAFT_3260302 [Favolaschia claudopus]|uniref:WSC domain-containing protein n=1 Tax=Favolaschia claudopus TaxID=2862362 RepID=A0AAW0CQJ7_9AGAR